MDEIMAAILDTDFDDDFDTDDVAIDFWHDGVLDALRGRPAASPRNPDYFAGYEHGLREARVAPVMPERPEGYYHAPIGTFE
jgi:hypothetical protein